MFANANTLVLVPLGGKDPKNAPGLPCIDFFLFKHTVPLSPTAAVLGALKYG